MKFDTKHQINPIHLAIRCTSPLDRSDLTKEKQCSEHRIHLEPCEQNGYLGRKLIRCETNPVSCEQVRSLATIIRDYFLFTDLTF